MFRDCGRFNLVLSLVWLCCAVGCSARRRGLALAFFGSLGSQEELSAAAAVAVIAMQRGRLLKL